MFQFECKLLLQVKMAKRLFDPTPPSQERDPTVQLKNNEGLAAFKHFEARPTENPQRE